MSEQASSSVDKGTLMLVDDDAFLLSIYANRFSKNGYQVTSFSDPVVALEKIKSGFKPKTLILDLLMPGLNGIDFLRSVREGKLVPETTTVVVLTNQSDSVEMDDAKSVGVDGYIIKAASIPSEVVEKVDDLVAAHKPK